MIKQHHTESRRRIIQVLQWVGVLLIGGCFVWYNHIFVRSRQGSKAVELVNSIPYEVHFDIEQDHPTTFFTLPQFPAYAKWCHEHEKLCSLVPLQKLYADMQWIGSIQYVGSVGGREKLNGLGALIDNVTTLDPYWYYPYVFGQLMIPQQKRGTTTGEIAQQLTSRQVAHDIATKGEYYLCDQQKVARIRALSGDVFMHDVYESGARLRNGDPCPTYELPHYAGFNAFYYRGDAEDAAHEYMISAFHKDAPGITPVMAAMVYGRGGQHLKSAALRYDRYTNIISQDQTDTSDILKADAAKALKKSVFELQLQLITEAADLAGKACSTSYSCLIQKGYILKAIQHTQHDICQNGKNIGNLRCGLYDLGIEKGRITPQGKLHYPDGGNYEFARSDDYNSWRIQPTK